MTRNSFFTSLLFLSLVSIMISACGGDDNIFRNDYSDAPELPDTTNVVSKVISDTGLIYYVISEGDTTSFDVAIRDDMFVYYTTRTTDGEIVASSFVNGSTEPDRVNNIGSQSTISFVGDGFVEGVLGMYEGERRVLVIPAELNTTSTSETIILDIELETIEY